MSDGPSLRPIVAAMLERLRGMERSRFWHARNRFFDFKHRLGLSRDRAWQPFELPEIANAMLDADDSYSRWIAANAARPADVERLRAASARFVRRPVFSIVLPIRDATPSLRRALNSLREQAYGVWQLVLVVTPSAHDVTSRALEDVFGETHAFDIAMLEASATASAADLLAKGSLVATGDFVAFFDTDDAYAPDAFYEFAAVLHDDPAIDIVYGDEDVRTGEPVQRVPFFKPDFSAESIRSRDYVGTGAIYRRRLVEACGGVRSEFEAATSYDLLLRLTERGASVAHVSRVLYHRDRVPDLGEAGARAISASLERSGEFGTVEAVESPFPTYRVRYRLRDNGLVSIVIPTRDHAEDLERCLASIFEKTTYERFEVLLVDNGTKEARALDVIDRFATRDECVRVLRMPIPFNYSKLNNDAIRESRGDFLVLLNNDTEVFTRDWLEALIEQAQRPEIGAVGASLLYPDGSFQHGGVILGIGGVAGHSHRFADPGSAGYFGALRACSNYAAVTAACLMVRRDAYDSVGGMDESLTVAFNDVDFCLRLLHRSLRNVWLPHVVLVHGESKSRGHDVGFIKEHRSIGEEKVMLERYGSLIERDPYYNVNLTRRAEDFAIRREIEGV